MYVSQVVAVAPALPEHRHAQGEITDAFAEVVLPAGTDRAVLDRLHQATGVTHRHLALPLADYPGLGGFGAACRAPSCWRGCRVAWRAIPRGRPRLA